MSIIKIKDLEILCIPKFAKVNLRKKEEPTMITRIDLVGGEKIRFVNAHQKIQFRRLTSAGLSILPGNKIRFFKHDIDPVHKFYLQAKYNELDQTQFFTLSDSKGDAECTATGLLKAMNIDWKKHPASFDSTKLTQVMSDDGWLLEVDITNYINSITV